MSAFCWPAPGLVVSRSSVPCGGIAYERDGGSRRHTAGIIRGAARTCTSRAHVSQPRLSYGFFRSPFFASAPTTAGAIRRRFAPSTPRDITGASGPPQCSAAAADAAAGGEGREASPEERAGLLSKLTFGFLDRIIKTGYQRPLDDGDLPELAQVDQATRAHDLFDAAWSREVAAKGEDASVLRALVAVFGGPLVLSNALNFAGQGIAVAGPLVLQRMVAFVKSPAAPAAQGYRLALLLLLGPLVGTLCNQHLLHIQFRAAIQMRAAVCGAVYRKALRLSNRARQQSSVGKIVNLMSIDAQRFVEFAPLFQSTFSSPVVVIVVVGLLFRLLGWPALAGLTVMAGLFPVNMRVARQTQELRRAQNAVADRRVQMASEILQGMRAIKYAGWEAGFRARMEELRDAEVDLVRRAARLKALATFLLLATPSLTSTVTFAAFALAGGAMSPERVFSGIALFAVLRFPLTYFPAIVGVLVQLRLSLQRVKRFLLSEEVIPVESVPASAPGPAIAIKGASFCWDCEAPDAAGAPRAEHAALDVGQELDRGGIVAPGDTPLPEPEGDEPAAAGPGRGEEGPCTLTDIALEVPRGHLCAVVGPVGSGKSSLAAAVLGEIPVAGPGREGPPPVRVAGRVAYVPQQAWIMNATLRENVLFGLPYEEGRYRAALAACALERDLTQLPAGDLTEIGEKGITLSGGQRQRVSLARAVYAEADVYVLDDVLSAVDAHVARHILERCIHGALAGKTRLLVTNQVGALPAADRVVVLQGGRIAEEGTYEELLAREGALAALVRGHRLADFGPDEEAEEEAAPAAPAAAPGTPPPAPAAPEALAAPAGPASSNGAGAGGGRGALTREEGRETGAVDGSVYRSYVAAAGGARAVLPILAFFASTQAWQMTGDVLLSQWTSGRIAGLMAAARARAPALVPAAAALDPLSRPAILFYLGLQGACTALYALSLWLRTSSVADAGARASSSLFRGMFRSVMRAPASFFDSTPVGRILNRFAKDLDQVDQFLPNTLEQFVGCQFAVLSIIGVMCGVVPRLLLLVAPLVALFAGVQQYYRATSRELARLEAVSKSPVFALFGESLAGASSIRAYGAQGRFVARSDALSDANARSYFLMNATNRWLGMRLDVLGGIAMFGAGALCVAGRGRLPAGAVGLCLSYALSL
eukprot:tig00000769_g3996.t1